MAASRPSSSRSYASTSYQSHGNGYNNSNSRSSYGPRPSTSHTNRPSTGFRSRSVSRAGSRASSVFGGRESQRIVCAVSEGRGVSPTVGLAFINISTGEAVLSQVCDNQFYVRTLNKLEVFDPTEILIVSTCGPPTPSKMYNIIQENIIGAKIITVDRNHWAEARGLDYIQQLAFVQDTAAIKVAIGGNYFATCCFAAVRQNFLSTSYSLISHFTP
jgi:DNA mismatch repair protein MSH4